MRRIDGGDLASVEYEIGILPRGVHHDVGDADGDGDRGGVRGRGEKGVTGNLLRAGGSWGGVV